MAGRIDAAELGPGRLVGHHRPQALGCRLADARHHQRDLARRARPRHQRGDARRSGRSSRASSGSASAASATALRASASAGAIQSCSTSSAPSCSGGLRRRRRGDEEARVEALGAAERRQPVAQVDQAVGGEAQAARRRRTRRCRCSPRCSAPRHGARRAASLPSRSTSVAVAGAREQQARFLEALADRGDVVVEAAAREAEAAARLGVVEAGARRHARRVARHRRCRRERPRRRCCGRRARRAATAAPRCRRRRRGRRRSSRRGAAAARARGGGRGGKGGGVGGGGGHRRRRRWARGVEFGTPATTPPGVGAVRQRGATRPRQRVSGAAYRAGPRARRR